MSILDSDAIDTFVAWAEAPARWDALPNPAGEEAIVQHARDITDQTMLALIGQLQATAYRLYFTTPHWVSQWDLAGALRLAGYRAHHGSSEMPSGLVLAKAARLIDRGLRSGCACGCRGDFELTAAGASFVAGAADEEDA